MDQLPPRSCLHQKAPGIRKQSDEKDTVLPPQAHIPCCDQSKGCSASCLLAFRVRRLDTALLILPRARQCLRHLARQQEQQRQQECGLLSTLPSESQAKASDFPNLNQIQKPAWKTVSEDTSCRDGLTFTSHTRGCHGSEQPVCAVVGNYRFLGSLGEGAYSTVKLARHVLTAREVAIKILDKTKCNLATLQMINREIKIMTMLHHPHIVQLYEVINSGTNIYLIMEYARHGDVYDYLLEVGRMYEDEAREKFRQVVSAVEYCHRMSVAHRDLKPENLLLSANREIKLADFGLSAQFTPGTPLTTYCGTPYYVTPEIVEGKPYHGPSADVWSLGVLLYMFVTGTLPFKGDNLKVLEAVVAST
ncbi:MAP/microtubule affinity-regulating kinase 4-like [Eulemur rufifrons]|uniref:MAP/microtubule affinity-regulating kinase 4-like n=1 Tax=Eulemur rufifrons TaxID=859984 RepID=UPI003743F4ED